MDSDKGTQDIDSPDGQYGNYGADRESILGERDLGIDHLGIPQNLANGDLRHST